MNRCYTGEPTLHLFSSVAYVWVYLEQKLLGRSRKSLVFLKSNFFLMEQLEFTNFGYLRSKPKWDKNLVVSWCGLRPFHRRRGQGGRVCVNFFSSFYYTCKISFGESIMSRQPVYWIIDPPLRIESPHDHDRVYYTNHRREMGRGRRASLSIIRFLNLRNASYL
jgi:hypothetical protein